MTEHAQHLYQALGVERLIKHLINEEQAWAPHLENTVLELLTQFKHGDLHRWLAILNDLPEARNVEFDFNRSSVSASCSPALDKSQYQQLLNALIGLKPWRKGPYQLFGIEIDSEWRSDLKWERFADHIDLEGKRVLDVGCANGYFGWRMLGAGASHVVGIDPSWLFIIQFLLLKHYTERAHIRGEFCLLPVRMEAFPAATQYFDTVFSMGVLYHRRSVFDHLSELRESLKPNGELLLETLVIPADYGQVLVPRDRYARMRNVWFLPSSEILCDWLLRAGYTDIELIDESATTLAEQRKTEWLKSETLEHALDPDNPKLTVEGYPAPRRAVIYARRAR